MRVLLLNHTSTVSGGERSLLDLLKGLPEKFEASVACPAGPLAELVAHAGTRVHEVPGTDASLKLHPWYTPRALARMATTATAVSRLARRLEADVIYANSIRAGIVATLARRMGGPPAIVHMHDRLPPGRASAITLSTLGRGADAIIANSRYTAASMDGRARGPLEVVHNPVDTRRFDPTRVDVGAVRRELGLGSAYPVLGIVAQLTPWKAQDDAIAVVAKLRERYPAARLLVAGAAMFVTKETRYDNATYERSLRCQVADLGLDRQVHFLGERDDVPELLDAIDVLLVPSWEEPFGRSVVEGMAMGVPVVATSVGGPREIIENGVDGLLLEPRQPWRWAEAIAELVARPGACQAIGACARERATARFSLSAHADAVVSVYEEVVRRSATGRPGSERPNSPGAE